MLADPHWMGELGEPTLQPSPCGLLQRRQVRSHLACLRVVPFPEFGNELKQPCQTIGTLEACSSLGLKVSRFLCDVVCGETLPQGFACGGHKCSIGKSPDEPCEQPMPVHRGMPVIASVERWRQFSRRCHIRIAVQGVANVVRIFLVDARERKIGEPLSGVGVKHGWACAGLRNTHSSNREEGKHRADRVFHDGYFRRIAPNAANPQNRCSLNSAPWHRTGYHMPRKSKDDHTSTSLKGWQQIARFLGQPISVAERWAKSGMPVLCSKTGSR